MKIHEMALLVRVAETGSMTLAARQLHLTPAAVSAAVRRIEHDVDVRIFERTTRTLHPTEEGLVILEACQEMVVRWQRALDDAQGQRAGLAGEVHLSAPADTTYQVLEPVVAALCAEHPRLRIVLNTSDALRHLHRDAIDMAIRYGPLQDSGLLMRRLATPLNVLVAAPAYLAAHGTPDTLADLATHRCLTLHRASVPTTSWTLWRDDEAHTVAIQSPLCGDGYLARRWALAGMGIALKSLFDVIEDLEAGRLTHVLPALYGRGDAIHAVFPSRRFVPARVRVVSEAIAAVFAARMTRCDAWVARPDVSHDTSG